jgi:putative endonuclease
MQHQHYYVYILTRARNSVFYVGVTNNLVRRVHEHKMGLVEGFTQKYNIKQLVYYEQYEDIQLAIQREKSIKKWKRQYKINAIEGMNPDWKDLYFDIC